MVEEKIRLTKHAKEMLEARRETIINVDQPKNAQDLAFWRSQGDLSENADYSAARDRQAQLASELEDIEYKLNHCIVDTDSLIGHRVTYKIVGTDKTETVDVVGDVGADPFAEPAKISYKSPLGEALSKIGIGESEIVECNKPYTIELVENVDSPIH